MLRIGVLALLCASLAACTVANGAGGKLANSTWQVVRIDGRPAVSPNARLAFAGDRLSASAGCNTIGGSWRTRDGRLVAGQLMTTEMYCTAPLLMEQERALTTLLSGAPEFSIERGELELRTGGHSAQMRRER